LSTTQAAPATADTRWELTTELDGTRHLIAVTETDIWEWDDGTEEWLSEPLTPQTEIEDCEDAWVAASNVTCTADATYFKQGTKSAKQAIGAAFYGAVDDCEDAWAAQADVTCDIDEEDFKVGAASATAVVADAFTTGLIATEDIDEIDLSGYNRVAFWFKSSLALDAGDLQLVLSEALACGAGGATEVFADLPAIVADTWTVCHLTVDMTGMDAVLSVGLKAVNDPGACTLKIDDVNMLASAGLIAHEDIDTADLSGYDTLRFWIRSDTTIETGTLQLILSLANDCTSEDLLVEIPDLTADIWTYVESAETLVADTESVGIKTRLALASGVDIYIDDVRAFDSLTADLDGHYTFAWLNDVGILCNGTADGVLKWDGDTRGFTKLLGYDGYAGGHAYHRANIVLAHNGHVVLVNNWEGGTQYKRRIRWSSVATLETWAQADYLDVYGSEEEVIGAAVWGDYIVLLTTNSLSLVRYVGGAAIYAADTPLRGDCCRAPRSVQGFERGVFYMGLENVYWYQGGTCLLYTSPSPRD